MLAMKRNVSVCGDISKQTHSEYTPAGLNRLNPWMLLDPRHRGLTAMRALKRGNNFMISLLYTLCIQK